MNHESYQQQISQLVDNELAESHEQDLFVHLGSCKECRNFLKSSWQMQSDIESGKPRELSLSEADEGSQPLQLQTKPLTVPMKPDQSVRKNLSRRFRTGLDNQSFFKHIWSRRLSLSYPVVATAAIIGITLGILVTDRVINTQPTPSVVYISTIPECEVVAPIKTH